MENEFSVLLMIMYMQLVDSWKALEQALISSLDKMKRKEDILSQLRRLPRLPTPGSDELTIAFNSLELFLDLCIKTKDYEKGLEVIGKWYVCRNTMMTRQSIITAVGSWCMWRLQRVYIMMIITKLFNVFVGGICVHIFCVIHV